MRLEPATIAIVVHPAGLVVEGPSDDPAGRRVEARPASGGRADSVLSSDGSFDIRWAGSLDRGRPGEGRAVKSLIQAMTTAGLTVERVVGARDDRGEDAKLLIDGKVTSVQCVSVPVDSNRWATLHRDGELRFVGDADAAVALVRDALEHKRDKARGTLLLLDMAQVGAIVAPSLVRGYRAKYPDPEIEFQVAQAWLVGPTARSAVRLSGPAIPPA